MLWVSSRWTWTPVALAIAVASACSDGSDGNSSERDTSAAGEIDEVSGGRAASNGGRAGSNATGTGAEPIGQGGGEDAPGEGSSGSDSQRGGSDGGPRGGAPAGGTSACLEPCADGFDCTLDTCRADGTCGHAIGPNTGATSCPPGTYCTVQRGCVDAPVCANDDDCEEALGDDPCRGSIRCDPASSLCLFERLDKDFDGHSPPVCGGDDCDDGDQAVSPSATEACDGLDNNCDGEIDGVDAYCPLFGPYQCVNAECICPAENRCGTSCTDFDSNLHCGACDHRCGTGEVCRDGECVCQPDHQQCGDECTLLVSDPAHCGACDVACGDFDECRDGECITPISCGGQICYWPMSVCVQGEPVGVYEGWVCTKNTCGDDDACDLCSFCDPEEKWPLLAG